VSLTLTSAVLAAMAVFAGGDSGAVSTAPLTTTTSPPSTTSTTPGTVTTMRLPSGDADGRMRAVWVYRPAVHDSADLPVVYFLHGYPGTADDLAGAGFPDLLDAAFAAGAEPFVVVAPTGESTAHPDTEWADSLDGTVRLESFIVDTVIPAVEGAHPRDRTRRAIAGFSMGGYGAMNLGLHHPDLFGQIVSIAGYYHIDDPDLMGGGDPAWAAANSPDQHVGGGASSRILLITDTQEADPLIRGEARRYQRLAEAVGQHPTFTMAPGGHTWVMVASQIPTIVRFLNAGW
jgi:S-formylglutathione hydrolase FrmB